MIVRIIRSLATSEDGDVMLIHNQDWSFWVVDRMPENVRRAFGDEHLAYAEGNVTETGISISHSVPDPHWPPSEPPAEVSNAGVFFAHLDDDV
jgi:hypothetical protein